MGMPELVVVGGSGRGPFFFTERHSFMENRRNGQDTRALSQPSPQNRRAGRAGSVAASCGPLDTEGARGPRLKGA